MIVRCFKRGCFDPLVLSLIPMGEGKRLEFHFDPLIMGCVLKGVVVSFSGVVFVSYTPWKKENKRTREEEEGEDSKEGTPSPKDPKPSLKGSTLGSPLLPLNPKPSFKAQGLGRTFQLGITLSHLSRLNTWVAPLSWVLP
jgi:hypothetical protein